MPCDEMSIELNSIGKVYRLYGTPRDRIKQFVISVFTNIFRLKSRDYFSKVIALDGVSLKVKKGATVGILGANGSGKSTLLQIVAGTIAQTTGTVKTSGRIAAILELGSGFNPAFTGRENVYMNGAILGLSKNEIDDLFPQIHGFSEIGEFIDNPVRTYSSGMVVRLAFSIAACNSPDVLILDEALAVGDAAFQFKCHQRLRELTESGTTILLVSHDLNIMKMYCDEVLYLKSGRQRAYGLPEDVINTYIMDLRSDQTRSIDATRVVGRKAGLGSAFSYGTDEGRFVRVDFVEGGTVSYAQKGQRIKFFVELEFSRVVETPSFSVLVESAKKIPLGGRRFPIVPTGLMFEQGDTERMQFEVSFPVNLLSGEYFISVRLEDSRMAGEFVVLDKQGPALSFSVTEVSQDLLGIFDFDINATLSMRLS